MALVHGGGPGADIQDGYGADAVEVMTENP